MTRAHAYIAVLLTILSTAYGQIIIKWQVNQLNGFVISTWPQKIMTILGLLFNPWIMSSLGAAVIASLLWMAAMTKLDLSQAYPFTALNLILVPIVGMFVFNEACTAPKMFGISFVVVGLLILSRQ